MARAFGFTIFLLFIAASILTFAHSARLLDEVEAQPQVVPNTLPQTNPGATSVPPATTTTPLPSGQIPAVTPSATADEDDDADLDIDIPAPVAPTPGPTTTTTPGGNSNSATSATTAGNSNSGPGPVVGSGATTGANPSVGPAGPHEPTLSFFMHDIIGGSHPSARVVTGIIAQTEVNGIPFSKANNNIFPVNGGTPLVNLNNINQLINPNTAPLLTGLNGAQTNTIVQNTGNNNNALNGNNLPFVTAGQLPPGSALQQLMFGTITVVDDELTEGHELGSAVIGRAQGFYLASSLDGTSQTMALTVLLHGEHDHDHHDGVEDAISFFGVHRTATLGSQVAVVGGTGKYENAKGYAVLETLHNQEDQHTTDGVDTILHVSIYLTY